MISPVLSNRIAELAAVYVTLNLVFSCVYVHMYVCVYKCTCYVQACGEARDQNWVSSS